MHSVDGVRGDLNQHLAACGGDLSGEIAQIVRQHGEEADIVAAKRADLSFRTGDTIEGARWVTIFRTIAASHLGRAQAHAEASHASRTLP